MADERGVPAGRADGVESRAPETSSAVETSDRPSDASRATLRIILLGAIATDKEMLVQSLERALGAIRVGCAADEAEMRKLLAADAWNAIVVDWVRDETLARSALQVVADAADHIPVLAVAARAGDGAIVEAVRAGVRDYVCLDSLDRLVPAIKSTLVEKRTRAALRRLEPVCQECDLRFKRLSESGIIGIVVADFQGHILEANETFLSMLDYTPEDLAEGRVNWAELTPSEWRHVNEEIGRQLRAYGRAQPMEKEYFRKDGSRTPVLVGVAALQGPYAVSFSIDLSERKRAEEALGASERRFSRLSESGIIGIGIADSSGRVSEANDAFLRLTGHSRADLTSGSVRWAGGHGGQSILDQLASGGTAPPWEDELERKDGTRVPVLLGAAMLDESSCIVFAADLTERKRAEATIQRVEDQLRQTQKLDAIGRLAGGVAHDFNNLLSIILSYATLILDTLGPDDPTRADVHEVRKAGERASELTRQLLAFSRQQVLAPKVVDLDRVVGDMEKMLRRLLGEDVELVLIKMRGLGKIIADPSHIEQVVMNLAVNARDAMPQGGKLCIETNNVELDAAFAADHVGVIPGPYVMLSVTDTGCGMDADTLAHIFEPFFTTKEQGRGTGLGLATVFGIVKQAGGHIAVESEPEEGTAFKVYFRRTDASLETAESVPPPSTVGGSETILLVEDDEDVRTLARSILQRRGYNVLEAQNGGEAFLISEKLGSRIHLLVTDMVMPRMSGRELAERLTCARPDMKVLYVSGYGNASAVRGSAPFLQKPITPYALLKKVREVIDSPSTRGSERPGQRPSGRKSPSGGPERLA